MSHRDNLDVALEAANANAALDGVNLTDQQQELIRLHQAGRLTKDEFLRRARDLAEVHTEG